MRRTVAPEVYLIFIITALLLGSMNASQWLVTIIRTNMNLSF